MTIAGSYILRSWQLQLVLTIEFCIKVRFLRRYLDINLSSLSYQVMGTWIYCWFYEGKDTLGKVDPVLYYLMS